MRETTAKQLTFEDVPIETVLTLPPPISVNRIRRIDPASIKRHLKWVEQSDALVYEAGGMRRFRKISGQFTAHLTIDENLNRADLDNCAKTVIDYAKRLGLITDDGKRYMRRITIEFGDAPLGCRLLLKELK